jgi:hypothetical protein
MKHTDDPADRWSQDEFEMQIADMMDAAYRTPVSRTSSTMKARASRITPGILDGITNTAPHMPGKDRLVLPHQHGFDLENDPLPARACISIPGDEGRQIGYLRRMNAVIDWRDLASLGVSRMPDDMPWYRASYLYTSRRALRGMTLWCWIDAAGQVRMADSPGFDAADPAQHAAVLDMICTTLQAQADRRFCWEIAADEGFAKASLGCTAEEVKSLLYARELPVTATGRKRPILHLVAAHRRRMKEGIDVDIKPFLRGVAEVTMDGTRFKVRAPENRGEE